MSTALSARNYFFLFFYTTNGGSPKQAWARVKRNLKRVKKIVTDDRPRSAKVDLSEYLKAIQAVFPRVLRIQQRKKRWSPGDETHIYNRLCEGYCGSGDDGLPRKTPSKDGIEAVLEMVGQKKFDKIWSKIDRGVLAFARTIAEVDPEPLQETFWEAWMQARITEQIEEAVVRALPKNPLDLWEGSPNHFKDLYGFDPHMRYPEVPGDLALHAAAAAFADSNQEYFEKLLHLLIFVSKNPGGFSKNEKTWYLIP